MALTAKFYSLRNVTITLNTGAVVDATEIQIKRKLKIDDRTAGGSATEQRVLTREMAPDIQIKGFNSDNLNVGDLVPGTQLTALTVLADTDSLLQTDFFTKWPVAGMIIGDTDTTISDKPSEWTTKIEAGVLNPVVAG